MTPQALAQDLRSKIPVSAFLGLEIIEATPKIARLKFPLAPNLNHVQSAFGGSIYSAGALACYALFRMISLEGGIQTDSLVIHHGAIEYLAPVLGDFEAICERPSEATVARFLTQYQRHNKARLELSAIIQVGNAPKAKFTGSYVMT